uniref:Uncharacterized protein n=1 Tax=Sphaerodactylus townsendi TaxID=933632 RepID=A0ACB8EWW5_9SAUR
MRFREFLQTVKPSWAKGDGFIKGVWEHMFECSFPSSGGPSTFDETCTGEERLETVPATFFEMSMTGHSYSIYNAVYAVAHSLHALYTSPASYRMKEHRGSPDVEPWQLYSFLQRMSFNNSAGDEIVFNDHGELEAGFDITNVVTFPNNSYTRVKVGRLDPQAPPGKEFTVQPDKIEWNHNLSQNGKKYIDAEAVLLGAAQDFMAFMPTMGRPQVILNQHTVQSHSQSTIVLWVGGL